MEGVALAIPLYYNGVIDELPLATVEDGVSENVTKYSELERQQLYSTCGALLGMACQI